MTDVIVYPGRTGDSRSLPPLPYPSDPAWLNPATVRWIVAITEPTRDELVSLYGTCDPVKLRRMPYVLDVDIAAAERYAAENPQVAA